MDRKAKTRSGGVFAKVLVIMGAVLLIAALLLLLYNRYESDRAGKDAEALLEDVLSVVEQNAAAGPELPVVEVDGYGCVGYLEVPSLELTLPVLTDWDYEKLRVAPCLQFGSSRTDDLVIAAHNFKRHFGRLKELSQGDAIVFTDMDGIENHYEVAEIETLQPTAVDEVQNSGYALVLYTCTPGGRTRVTVFCDRAAEDGAKG